MINDTPQYISLTEAAQRLGYGSTSTLALKCREERIPGALKIGKTWAVPTAWVEEQEKLEKQPITGGIRGSGVRKKT